MKMKHQLQPLLLQLHNDVTQVYFPELTASAPRKLPCGNPGPLPPPINAVTVMGFAVRI
jgi:hypothetical protein